jgi:hypothetical protein
MFTCAGCKNFLVTTLFLTEEQIAFQRSTPKANKKPFRQYMGAGKMDCNKYAGININDRQHNDVTGKKKCRLLIAGGIVIEGKRI